MFLRVLWQYLAVSAQRAEAAAACHLSAGGGAGWRRLRPAHNRERRGECASPVQHVGGRLHGGHGPGRRAPRGARTGVDLQVRLEALGRHRVGQDDVVQAIVQPPGHELAVGLQRRVQQRPHLCQALALVYLRRPLAPLNHRQMNTPRQAAKRPCQLQQVPQRVRRISACLLPPPVTCAARQPPHQPLCPAKWGSWCCCSQRHEHLCRPTGSLCVARLTPRAKHRQKCRPQLPLWLQQRVQQASALTKLPVCQPADTASPAKSRCRPRAGQAAGGLARACPATARAASHTRLPPSHVNLTALLAAR